MAASLSHQRPVEERFRACIDGSSQGNPGSAGIGVVIQGPDGEGILEISSPIGYRTNNQAEYEALIRALKEAHRLGIGRLLVQTDSELLYYQWRGEYRVRDPELKRLQLRAQQIARGFKELTLRVIPRKENRLADRLAKDAAVR